MRSSLIGSLGGVILVGLAVAQAPSTQPPSTTQPTPTTQPPRPTPGTPFRGRGFQPTPPDASGRGGTTIPSRPDAPPLPVRNFPPLPESSAVGKLVMLEILLADVAGSFENPTAAKILEMEHEGRLSGTSKIRLTSLENQLAFAQFSEMAPRVAGRTNTGLTVTPIYNTVNVGTIVQATTRMESDGAALVQIYVEKSAMEKAPNQDVGEPQPISRVTAQSTVRVPPGEPVLISTGPSATPAANQTWIVLSFRVL
jgi:type II/III secretion system protein